MAPPSGQPKLPLPVSRLKCEGLGRPLGGESLRGSITNKREQGVEKEAITERKRESPVFLHPSSFRLSARRGKHLETV